MRCVGHGACREEKYLTFWWENLNENNPLDDCRKGGDNDKMDLTETGWEVVDWIHLVQDRDKWRDFVNMVMSIRFP
jgi:hypothetical protein